MRRVLVTGALGQIGSELVPELRRRFGSDRVIASDIRMLAGRPPSTEGDQSDDGVIFVHVDCTRPHQLHEVVHRYDVGTIYHLAAVLSAVAEEKPQIAWTVNMGGLY
ncbi:MAG: NAD-dependent epimerase/dehydratase family protein, partial [Hyphomicrobiaceae bacterium]